MITTPEIVLLASERGIKCSLVTVMVRCKELGLEKTAGKYILTPAQAELVLKGLRGKPGRPPGPQPWTNKGITRQAWYLRQGKKSAAKAKKAAKRPTTASKTAKKARK